MLVLTRKTQQQIQIGEQITITILRIKGQSVRVGIQAPGNVCVVRTELAEKLGRTAEAGATPRKVSKPHATNAATTTKDNTEPLPPQESSTDSARCRAPGVVTSPVSPHPQRPGSASLKPVNALVDALNRRRMSVR